LGQAWERGGRLAAATAALERAVRLRPGQVEGHRHLARLLIAQGRHRDAARSLSAILQLIPDDAEAWRQQALTKLALQDVAAASSALRKSMCLTPGSALAHYAHGQILIASDNRRAADAFGRSVAAAAQLTEAWINRGVALRAIHRMDPAAAANRCGLVLDPQAAVACNNLAGLCQAASDVFAADRWYRRAHVLAPNWVTAANNALMNLGYMPRVSDERLFAEARRWEERFARPAYRNIPIHANSRDPDRRLKIGYLSGDLYGHVVGSNIFGLLQHHDRRNFEIACFSSAGRYDDVAARIRGMVDHWREVENFDDATVADIVRQAGIDILFVTAGHVALNRLGVAGYKPAPIMVSYADFTSTGLEVMDYWLSDRWIHPPGQTTERFTETLLRLPMMVLHHPIAQAPPVVPPAASARGVVTFGSCNNPAKINDDVVAVWARILAAVPNARLLLKYITAYDSPYVRARYIAGFARHGIDPGRLVFRGGDLSRGQQLHLVSDIDIALDPFPFTGCTTTFEALWMGVPVVTLAGSRFLGRMSTSFLGVAGLDWLIADDPDRYVACAVALAGNLERLQVLRGELRPRVAASPLCDAPRYARNVEKAFRTIWRRYCRGDPKIEAVDVDE
jgi:predicted O-linked N-acetylglucosamine transferase (SPINDLY family)